MIGATERGRFESTAPAVQAIPSKQQALRLLRRRSFSAGYLVQVIDLVVREVVRSQFDEPDEHEAAQVQQRLIRYAANGQPGSTELARAMLDVKHAVNLVRHGNYRVTTVPESGPDTTVSAKQLVELAAEAGRHRVLAAQGGALVVLAEDKDTNTVYRPVSAEQAHDLLGVARGSKEEAIRLHVGAVAVLRPQARMADWSRGDGYEVAVDVVRDEVTAQLWAAGLPETWALWEQGGVRTLCGHCCQPISPGPGTTDEHQAS
ncbi:hypothetical protein [Streptomyces clavuligerus]|uniref:hypothetical protein n=1 Tax=Streptomyces clavuligerus TaxID=1901 RepID=UPI00020D9539|nr:hypothetical protein [Streptomyces clavuligerus]WDN56202.1 hypothetical protein LL058_30590 [Streptomyces clavuligerus]